jgi:light-regulated signal transduction histidine kinase (bacteriophytochrome)
MGSSILFVKKLLKPIEQLKKGMELVSQGDFNTQIKVTAGDEIGELVHAFDAMAQQLKKTTASRDLLDLEVKKTKIKDEEILRLNADLEKKVKERTRALEESNKDLASFSYSISHDLRAPLRYLHHYTKLLEKKADGQLDPSLKEYLRQIHEAAQQMNQMIEDLLQYSRLGQARIEPHCVDMNELIEEISQWHREELVGREVIWKKGKLPDVLGDAALLKRCLSNLISNAFKFTKANKIALIETGFEATAENGPAFFVKDNGVGFDPNYQEKLFGIFQRLHDDKAFPGHGIGLASVKKIIQSHGGRVWATGRPKQGAAFFFTLPLASEGKKDVKEGVSCGYEQNRSESGSSVKDLAS